MFMQADWKREQELVISMEKDSKTKDDLLARTQEANQCTSSMISTI